ncbi:MAG: T9SS type A sorting domain-containing protein, partial [Candidatus Marinimicrobia bacterium]|nr:T9SS type A sorting domain-containing protein [Candidatus Neomarinimicrobiota bacterium]
DFTVLSTGTTVPAIQSMTIAEFLLDPGAYESELFRFDIAEITGGDPWPTSGNNANVTITDVSDSSLTMRVDKDTDLDENLVPQGTFNVAGIIDRYYDYQIKPRYMADIEILGDVSPVIMNIVQVPENPIPTDVVTVTADVIDDGTVTVNLNYMVDSGAYTPVAMTAGAGFEYSGDIPPQVDGSFVYYYISADDGVNAVVNSDTTMYAVWAPSDLTPITNIQYTTDVSGDSPFLGQEVTIGGVVTAEFWGSSSNRYIHVQDADSAWSGVVVFEYGGWDSFDFTTPLGDTVHTVAEGDSVVLTGTVDEYSGLTEIVDVTEFVVYGQALQPFDPITVIAAEIMTGGTMAEAYEGVLVKAEDVSVDNPDLGYGEWSFTDGTNSVRADDIWDYYFDPADQVLAEIVGVMTYSHSNTKLLPRLARDIVQSGNARFQRIQQVLYSDLLKAADDAESDISYAFGDTVALTGIVTMPTGLSYAGDGIKFVFADPKGGPWSAILSYAPDSSAYPVLYEGDSIVATGYIAEYGTNEANMTELFITQPINLVGIGSAPPMSYVDVADLMYPTTAEQWGNVMVTIGASEVVEHGTMSSNDGGIKVSDGTGEVWIDHDSYIIEDLWTDNGFPDIGTEIDSIRGWVYHHFGAYVDSTTYKLVPLWESDIAITIVGIDNDLQPESYALYKNYPNPFNPETQIQFRLGTVEKVTMVIYDIMGRQVRTLVKDNFSAGLHSVTWDGKNNKGAAVASGMYIYRIKAGSFTSSQKMLLLR